MIAVRARGRDSEVAAASWKHESWIVLAIFLVVGLLRSTSKITFSDDPADSLAAELIWGSMYLFAAWRLSALRRLTIPMAKRSSSLLVVIAIAASSAIWSVDPFASLKYGAELLGTTLVAWYIVAALSLERFLKVATLAFASLGIASLLLVYGSPSRGRMDWGAGPFCGVFADKNTLGAAMAIMIVTGLVVMPLVRGAKRYSLGCVLAIGAWLLLGSNSITAVSALLVTTVAVAVGLGIREKRYGIIVVVALAACLGTLVIFGFLGNDSSLFLSSVGRNSNLTGRTELWPPLLQAIGDRPILGYGYQSFFTNDVRLPYLHDFITTVNWDPPHAHNSFIQIALDTGLVGLAAFVVVLATAVRRGVGMFASGQTTAALWPLAIVVFLIAGSYDETYFEQGNTLAWIFFVAALLYPLKARAERNARDA